MVFEAYGQTVACDTILGVAEALREEFGDSIDAHPVGVSIEAGQVNRAFRVMARRILAAFAPSEADLRGLPTWVLRRDALRRLEASDPAGSRAGWLMDTEPGLGDPWLAYLALAPGPVIRDLLYPGSSEGGL